MRRPAVIIIAAGAALATCLSMTNAVQAQPMPQPAPIQIQASDPDGGQDTGGDMFQRGLEGLLDGLTEEIAPGLKALQDWADAAGPALESFIEEMGPALAEMMTRVRDWSSYEAPEILPNGDIIIRRKPEAGPLPPAEPPATPPAGTLNDNGTIDI